MAVVRAAAWGLVVRLWLPCCAVPLQGTLLDSVGCGFLVMQRILMGIAVPRPLPFCRDSRKHTPALGFLGAEM